MSMIKKVWNTLRGNKIYNDAEIHEIKEANTIYEELFKEMSTPAPMTTTLDTGEHSDIRLPRLPFNQLMFYIMRWQSVVLRTVCLKVKQEIFRETSKEGLLWEPTFIKKCLKCGFEHQKKVTTCDCGSNQLKDPDPLQKMLFTPFLIESNKAEQGFLEIMEELEDDVDTVDDLYLILGKDYWFNGDKLYGRVEELYRGDPCKFRIVSDMAGRRGGKYWTCVLHRVNSVDSKAGFCQIVENGKVCGFPMQDVHYVETYGAGREPIKYYIKGEVIHTSKYEPSRLYGIPPIFTLWVLGRAIQLMDNLVATRFEKGRIKGILGISTENATGLKKWYDQELTHMRQDPHYTPLMALPVTESGKRGQMEFVQLVDSLADLNIEPLKDVMRRQIAALYGVSPIFQSDLSQGGGLNNEGLQIKVTDRTVDWGQAMFHDKVFVKLFFYLGITDWRIKLRPSREQDEMAELERQMKKVEIAQAALNIGLDVKLEDDEFILSGQPEKQEIPQGENFGGYLPPGKENGDSKDKKPKGDGSKPRREQEDEETKKSLDLFKSISVSDIQKGLLPLSVIRKICQWLPFAKSDEQVDPECLAAKLPGIASRNPDWNKARILSEGVSLCQDSRKMAESLSQMKEIMGAEAFADTLTTLRDHQLAKASCKGNPPKTKGAHTYHCLENDTTYYFFVDDSGSLSFKGAVDRDYNKVRISVDQVKRDWGWNIELKKFTKAESKVRVFDMIRNQDVSGVSGIGKVATGIVFPDGSTNLRWLSDTASTAIFDSFEDFMAIHVNSHPENKTEINFYSIKESLKKELELYSQFREPKGKLQSETKQITDAFAASIEKIYQEELGKIEFLKIENKQELISEVDRITRELAPRIEKFAFVEVIRAYKKGKEMDVKKGVKVKPASKMPDNIDLGEAMMEKLSQADWQVLRGIYNKNPFWKSFQNMSQEVSDKLKEHIIEKFESVRTARFKATVRDVKRQYEDISDTHAIAIAYGRIGKFSLTKVIEQMLRTVNTQTWRLERIARTESTGITALGREMFFKENDPKQKGLYDWPGPMDHRTSDQCKEIERRVEKAGKGKGVPIEQLKEIMSAVVDDFNRGKKSKWSQRDWIPHANCRRLLRRTN